LDLLVDYDLGTSKHDQHASETAAGFLSEVGWANAAPLPGPWPTLLLFPLEFDVSAEVSDETTNAWIGFCTILIRYSDG
jgi:hypothetical protein